MDVLLGSEYLCSVIFTYNDPYTLFYVCQRVCKKWRDLLLSRSSDCCTNQDTESQWVALNKIQPKSPPLSAVSPSLSPSSLSLSSSLSLLSRDHQGTVLRRAKSIEKRKIRKPPNLSWREMVLYNCVPTKRKLHFLYLKGRATEMHSGAEFSGNFDILMLGWNYYFIRIQGEKYWRFSLVVNEFYCRFLRIFVGRPLRTRTRRLCFEEREDKGGSLQVSEVARVLFSSSSQQLLGLIAQRDDKIKLNRDCEDNVTFNNDWRSVTFEQPYYYPTLHCTLPHVINTSDKLIGKYTVDKVFLLDKYVREDEAKAWFEGIKEKSNTERRSYWDEIKQLA